MSSKCQLGTVVTNSRRYMESLSVFNLFIKGVKAKLHQPAYKKLYKVYCKYINIRENKNVKLDT